MKADGLQTLLRKFFVSFTELALVKVMCVMFDPWPNENQHGDKLFTAVPLSSWCTFMLRYF